MTRSEVDAILRSVARQVREQQDGWRFTVGDAADLGARAELGDGWLTLIAPWPEQLTPDRAWPLVCRNARLAGQAKYALLEDRLECRAEIPLVAGADWAGRLRQSYAGFVQAFAVADGAPAAPGEPGAAAEPAQLADLLEQAGWPALLRDPQRAAVELETGSGLYHQALVEQTPGGWRLTADLVSWREAAEESRRALAVLMLRACGAVRLIRAAAREEFPLRAWLEVCYPSAPRPAELHHALAALSVACRLCAQEAAALEDPALAQAYLELQALAMPRQQGGNHHGE